MRTIFNRREKEIIKELVTKRKCEILYELQGNEIECRESADIIRLQGITKTRKEVTELYDKIVYKIDNQI